MAEADGALYQRWCAGDRDAGRELFDRYYRAVARFFYNKASDAAAPDLLQNTFLACVEARERFRGDGEFRSFLFAIAHNVLRNHYRAQQRAHAAPLDFDQVSVADLTPSVSAALAERQEQRLLLEALRTIPLDCQEVLELHYWEGLSTADIAEVVAVPPGTVKSRLQRARRLLEETLTRLAQTPEILKTTMESLDRWAGELRQQATAGE